MIARTAICVILLLVVAASPSAAKRVALVIGNSAYQHTAPLPNPKNDAVAMAAALRRLNFEVVDGYDLDIAGFRDLLVKFGGKAAGADVAAVFYAGHAMQVDGINYVLPVDAKLQRERDLKWQSIPMDYILDELSGAKKLKLVLLDACRNNPLAGTMSRSMGTRSSSVGRGLAVVRDAPNNTLIAYATAGGDVAEDGSGDNSPFTTALLSHIEEPDLEIRLLFGKVSDSVGRLTNGRQKPYVYTDLGGDPFYLLSRNDENTPTPDDDRAEVASLSPAGYDRDTVFWESIKGSDDIEDFRAYLRQFPNGVYVYLARKHIKKLSQPVFEVASLDQTMWVAGSGAVNVRGGPTTDSEKIDRFEGLSEVSVTGRVEGVNWYRVGLSEGRTGFVFGDLLTEDDPVPGDGGGQVASLSPSGSDLEEAFYRRIEDSRDIEDFQEYLRLFPDGVNAYFARKRIEDLTPPDLSAGDVFRDCGDTVVASGEALPSGVFCGPKLVLVPPGSFMMGSTDNKADDDESPVHRVSIDYSLGVGIYEVTQSEWQSVMGSNPSRFKGGDRSVEQVSWNDAQEFIGRLNERTGQSYRLLTEAEWEYVARGGSTTAYSWGNSIGSGNANCRGCGSRWDRKETAPVGSFDANDFGLHDVHGNVLEWVADCYDKNAYETHESYSEMVGSWHDSCYRVVRGGSWDNSPRYLRSANRYGYSPTDRDSDFGFRVARTVFGP